jgi:SAM-dependent methyltransferase
MTDQTDFLAQIEENRLLHNRIADSYHHIHDDIFNLHEQSRIRNILSDLRSSLQPITPIALDFGCGSGNMTRHLRDLGCSVVSADISDRFVTLLSEQYKNDSMVKPYLLSGDSKDLDGYQFDFVCIYSVLHHLPDYLQVLRYLTDRIAPGGILYIDHEASDVFWQDDAMYLELQRQTRINKLRVYWRKFFSWSWYQSKYRMRKNPRYQPEGDIHVWHDDHIEWQSIRNLLSAEGFNEIYSRDYLAYRPYYPMPIFEKYAELTSDMHCSVFQRSLASTCTLAYPE